MERSEIIEKLNENKFNHIRFSTHINKYGQKRAFSQLRMHDSEGNIISHCELDGRVVSPMIKKGVIEYDAGYSKEKWFNMVSDTGYQGYRVAGTKLVNN